MEVSNKDLLFIIQENGLEVVVQKKGQKQRSYKLQDLPQKLQKFYIYSKQVCSAIRERNNKNRLSNEHGNFAVKILKSGQQCFEAYVAQSKIKVRAA